jgi:hypothetical protein
LLQKQPRPNRSLTDFQRRAGFFFSTEPPEKLTQIMNDTHKRSSVNFVERLERFEPLEQAPAAYVQIVQAVQTVQKRYSR